MGRLVGYMANRTDRLGDVLDQERDAIALPEDFRPDAWGIGFYQGGEVLHKKRPKLGDGPIDWEKVARGVRSDAVVIHFRKATVGDFNADNTHPFRMRQWLFAHNGTIEGFKSIRKRLADALPDFLQRNLRGSTDSEHLFHVLLSFLHDGRQLDRPDADDKIVLDAIRASIGLVDRYCAEVKAPAPPLSLVLTNGTNMYAVRRKLPLCYLGPSARRTSMTGAGALRYVMVLADGERVPAGYIALEDNTVLVIDRNLSVETLPL